MSAAGRPREFDRDAALHAAMLLFWRKGFVATSMTDLCEAMGIRSPSLYAAFGSKENLYVEAVQRYNAGARARIWDHIDDGPTMRDSMRNVLLAAAQVLVGGGEFPSGCMVNLATSGDETESAAQETVRRARSDSLKALQAGIQRAVSAHEVSPSTNADKLGRFYFGVVQGMAIQARDGATQAELEDMADIAMDAWPAA